MLRLDPDVPDGRVWLAPMLTSELADLRLDNVPLAGSRISMSVSNHEVAVTGMPPGLEVVRKPRPVPGTNPRGATL
jgi:hypothetical protein